MSLYFSLLRIILYKISLAYLLHLQIQNKAFLTTLTCNDPWMPRFEVVHESSWQRAWRIRLRGLLRRSCCPYRRANCGALLHQRTERTTSWSDSVSVSTRVIYSWAWLKYVKKNFKVPLRYLRDIFLHIYYSLRSIIFFLRGYFILD